MATDYSRLTGSILPQGHTQQTEGTERNGNPTHPTRLGSQQGLSKLEGRDGSPTRGRPGHRDGPQRRRGLPGLAFNNPYLQRVYCGLDVLAAIAVRFRVYITRSNNTGSVDTQTNRRAGGAARTRGRQGGTIVSMIDRLVWLTCDPHGKFRARRGDRAGAMRMTPVSQVLTTEEKYGEHTPTLRRPGNLSRRLTSGTCHRQVKLPNETHQPIHGVAASATTEVITKAMCETL